MSPILESIVSALPVAILVIVFGVYMAGIYFREDSKRKLDEYLKNIRNHDISIQKYNGLLGKYTEFENKPPFNTQFDTILKKLSELHSNRDREMKLYTRLRGETDQHSKKGFMNRILAPYHWLETHQKLNSLDHLDMIVATTVDAIGIDVHQLTHIQNEISRQITTTWQEIQELEHNIQILMQRGVRADVIAPYKHAYMRLRQQFTTIPAHLLTPSKTPSTSDDTLKHISRAYEILEESRPVLKKPLLNTRIWLEQTELLPQAIEQVSTMIVTLKDNVMITPESIDVTSFYDAMKEARFAVENAQKFSRQIDPIHLEPVLEELTRQYETLFAAGEELKTADGILQEYHQYRESLANQWDAIETMVPQLTSNPILPIVLTNTAEELEFIGASLTRLADTRESHPISRFKEETPVLQERINKLHSLQKDLLTMQTTQAELMTLVNRLQKPKLQGWTQKIEAARNRLLEFAPENYFQPPNWKELDLEREIVELNRQAEDTLPALNQPVREDELLEIWTAAHDIDRMVSIIQEGLNNQLQQRKKLLELEETIQQNLASTQENLKQLSDINLDRNQSHTIRQYHRQCEELEKWLSNRKEGKLTDKQSRLDVLTTEICAQLDEWLTEARENLRVQNDNLNFLVAELTKKAILADEVLQAIHDYFTEEEFDDQPEAQELEPILTYFVRTRTQQTQTDEFLQILQPIHAEVMQAMDDYQQIQMTFNNAIKTAGEFVDFSSSWNQKVVSLERVHQQAGQLDKEMESFLQNEHHSQGLVRKFKQYTSRYEELFHRLTSLVTEIEEEQKQQKEAEEALQKVMRQWELVVGVWTQDHIVKENVENLLKRYQNRYRDAKTSYERGKIRFSSFIASINSLKKNLSFEVVTNENNRSVEISGKEYV